MTSLEFASPWVLLGLLLLLLLPRRRGWPWRFAGLSLLLLALAQPMLLQSGGQRAVLLDVSDSVGDQALRMLQQLNVSNDSDLQLLPFAGESGRAASLEQATSLTRHLETGEVDIALALQTAQASGAARMLLISGGAQSRGDALAALPEVPVDVLWLPLQEQPALLRLLAPDEVTLGDSVEAVAVVHIPESSLLDGEGAQRITLRPSLGGQSLPPIERSLEAGQHAIALNFRAETSGELALHVQLEHSRYSNLARGQQRVSIDVRGEAQVLVLGDPAMAALLRAQGFAVHEGSAEDVRLPFSYDAVVLREGAQQFSSGQQGLLSDYVRAGGGLLMTGGPDSFGLGEWHRSSLETILPVTSELRSEVNFPVVATVVILDRSLSMRAERPSRISLARQGAIDLIDLAYSEDYIGMVVFDSDYEWIFRPRAATASGKLEMREAILGIEPQGGTIILPAYQEAIDSLENLDAAIKHIIILTDGEFFDGRSPFDSSGRPDFAAVAADARSRGITTTTIGIGEANFDIIERMARAGGGRFYGVSDTSTLPRIFTSEAIVIPRSVLRDEPSPSQLLRHPLSEGIASQTASVNAYIVSDLKADAEMLMVGQEREPLLAVAYRELGRSAALTTDLNQWAGELGESSMLQRLLGRTMRWLMVQPTPYRAEVQVEAQGMRLVVDAVQDGRYIDGERLEARYGQQRLLLEQTAPGRYETWLNGVPQGSSISVSRIPEQQERRPDSQDIVARTSVPYQRPQLNPQESLSLLQDIAARSGGSFFSELGHYQPPPVQTQQHYSLLFVALALAMFLAELVYRRWWL